MTTEEKVEAIKAARVGAGLTQEELAQRLGMTGAAVQSWESGRAFPRPKVLTKISELTKKPPSFFTGRPEDDLPEPQQPIMRMSDHGSSRQQDKARAMSAMQAAMKRLESAQKELNEAQAAVKAAMMMMEG